ncbi:uncharacterized protein EV420DRAFT_1617524 [Desarmillaria tabescens]|uniref:Selenoprotein O n=1 Tax=Armillaria tabescens TaxID=1929756 RepID=A0AA39NIF4_ARMTA|nr:uncharacterized protein EV420DRAFT_1617524 [Desarmillaria tabescens]KAK0466217.1 hypothetical protein EV420DRAFT_1617524 [Desarmillaria tabescens]
MTSKIPLSSFSIPPPTQLLNHNLTADLKTPSPIAFRKVLAESPSIQRRARLVDSQAHFSYVSPFPLSFPYEIEPDPSDTITDKAAVVEKWLSRREAIQEVPLQSNTALKKYIPGNREQTRTLIGLSETGIRDCVPQLDVGDAFNLLGRPALAVSQENDLQSETSPASDSDVSARKNLVDILGGHAVLMSDDFAPWSLRYSGHQFGTWAGQLGDGRAVTILVAQHPDDPSLMYELQLKGAGRTPYSRSADGLAVVRSSIREFLCSEAMQALSIPTSRSLALISLPDVPVYRERKESACILTRMAPSFLRIGSFEALNGPQNIMFFGGGQQPPNYEALRILGEWVSKSVLRLELEDGEAWGKKLVLDVAERNAKMVASWQAYGVSVLGLSIDYGPYAFMDIFDPFHICNHTDSEGRYSYKVSSLLIYALRALLNALAPLIGAEQSSSPPKAVSPGWSEVSKDQIAAWKEQGINATVISEEYVRFMRKTESDERLWRTRLLDFHGTFRALSSGRTGKDWVGTYEARVESEKDEWSSRAERLEEMKKANPRFVLRQWVLEEVIAKVEKDPDMGKRVMAKVLQMACSPFDPWGAEDDPRPDEELSAEEREERRYCGLGDKSMLGFQCSCSS